MNRSVPPRTLGTAPRSLPIGGLAILLAVSPSVQQQATRVDVVAPFAEALMAADGLPSLSIAILKDGEIEYARAWGYADIENGTPATVDTRYRAGSVSKVITATGLARLVQQGRLDLDAPVSRYVPSWEAEPAITPRQLAGHLAGVGHYQAEDRMERDRHFDTMEASLGVFRNSPRAGPPGAQYHYSTHGFTLLSAAMEGAAGEPFLQVLEDEVYEPLGMTNSGPDMRTGPQPGMSALYTQVRLESRLIAQPEDPSYKWAGGGLTSTPTDLVRMGWGYLNGFIDPTLVEEMWTSQRTNDGEETGVGIVWRIETDAAGRRVIHHSGAMGGARSTIAIFPDEGEAIAIMTNTSWPSDIHATAKLIMEAWRQDGADDGSALTTPEEVAFTGTFGEEEANGSLVLGNGTGWVTAPPSIQDMFFQAAAVRPERMTLLHVTGSTYALVTPLGALPLEIEVRDGRLSASGRVFRAVWSFEGG